MPQITLFRFENDRISIEIKAYFNDESLVIEGYDIGKAVKEFMGDSDYEYSTSIPEMEVRKLYPLMNVAENEKEGLLKAIERKFNTNTCYSEFLAFLAKNGIESKGFSWT